jgi:hypothetical protein
MWNYWRKLSWQTHSVEDLVGKTFTDEVVISHQRIWSVGKTVKCCSGCLVEVGMLCLPLKHYDSPLYLRSML